jgi:hypothetical protein
LPFCGSTVSVSQQGGYAYNVPPYFSGK